MDEDGSVVFEDVVPLRVVQPDREDQQISGAVRLSFGVHGPQAQNRFAARLTDDENLFFLYTLDVNEEDFQELKREQALLVDFATFPRKVVELLQLCIESRDDESPRYIAQLVGTGGPESVLDIVETNPFKHLVHLSLRFREGNDNAVTKYLAAELQALRASHAALGDELGGAREDLGGRLGTAEQDLADARAACNALRGECERSLQEAKISHAAELTATQEKSLAAQRTTREECEREKRELRQMYERQLEEANARAKAADAQRAEAATMLARAEAQVRELEAAATVHEREGAAAGQELAALREENRRLDAAAHAAAKGAARTGAEVSALRERVAADEAVAAKTQALVEAAEAKAASLDEALGLYRAQASKCEAKARQGADEVAKGNEIIRQLQADAKAARSRARARAAALKAKEEECAREAAAARGAERDMQAVRRELAAAGRESEQLAAQLQTATAKLAESQGLIESNQKVMAYLNSELTQRRLGTGGAAVAPRPDPVPAAVPVPMPMPAAAATATAAAARATAVLRTQPLPQGGAAWPVKGRILPRFTAVAAAPPPAEASAENPLRPAAASDEGEENRPQPAAAGGARAPPVGRAKAALAPDRDAQASFEAVQLAAAREQAGQPGTSRCAARRIEHDLAVTRGWRSLFPPGLVPPEPV